MATAIGVLFTLVAVQTQAYTSVVDDTMEIGWDFADANTLNFTMIVSAK